MTRPSRIYGQSNKDRPELVFCFLFFIFYCWIFNISNNCRIVRIKLEIILLKSTKYNYAYYCEWVLWVFFFKFTKWVLKSNSLKKYHENDVRSDKGKVVPEIFARSIEHVHVDDLVCFRWFLKSVRTFPNFRVISPKSQSVFPVLRALIPSRSGSSLRRRASLKSQ